MYQKKPEWVSNSGNGLLEPSRRGQDDQTDITHTEGCRERPFGLEDDKIKDFAFATDRSRLN